MSNKLPRRVKRAIAVLQGYCEKHDDCENCKINMKGNPDRCPLEFYKAVEWTPEIWEEKK